MAKAEIAQQTSRRRQNRFLVMLLVSAALVSAAKDLGRLHDLTSGVVGLAASVHERVNNAMKSPAEPSCQEVLAENDRSGQPYNWNGRVAPDQLIQTKGANVGIEAIAVVGATVELMEPIAFTRASCSELAVVSDKVGPRATEAVRRVTQVNELSNRNLARSLSANQFAAIRVRNSNRRLNFILRTPAEVELVSQAISDEVEEAWIDDKAPPLKVCPQATLRLDSLPVNGRLNITSPTEAMITGTELLPGSAQPNCQEAIEFKTANGIISLDLLRILRATLGAEAPNDDETAAELSRTLKRMKRITPVVLPAAEESH